MRWSQRIREYWCSHEYRVADLQPRAADGLVTWTCHKCGLVWRGEYGLANPHRIVGPFTPERAGRE